MHNTKQAPVYMMPTALKSAKYPNMVSLWIPSYPYLEKIASTVGTYRWCRQCYDSLHKDLMQGFEQDNKLVMIQIPDLCMT